MKRNNIIYWVATGALVILLLVSVSSFLTKYHSVVDNFTALGYPKYLIIPLGIAKVLAVITIVGIPSNSLKEWAYAGLFFNFILALSAHLAVQDGNSIMAIIAIVLLVVSYTFFRITGGATHQE